MNLRRLQRTPLGVRELCHFVALAEELHFARAAERVGINQSPLSKSITLLEKRLGVRLFVRTTKGTQLDVAGKQLLQEARKILTQIADADETVRRSSVARSVQLNVGLAQAATHPRVTRLLARFRNQEPITRIAIFDMPPEWQPQSLLADDQIDVAVFMSAMKSQVHPDATVVVIPLWIDTLVLAMPPDHRLAHCEVVQSIEGADRVYVAERIRGHEYEKLLENPLRAEGPRLGFLDSVEHLLTRVAFEPALGILAASHAENIKRSDVTFRPIVSKELVLTTYLARRSGKYAHSERHADLVSRFVECALEMAATAES